MPPEVYERVDVGGWSKQEIVPPFVVADVEATILVHPVDKLARMSATESIVV